MKLIALHGKHGEGKFTAIEYFGEFASLNFPVRAAA
jgi:hypothetical protein